MPVCLPFGCYGLGNLTCFGFRINPFIIKISNFFRTSRMADGASQNVYEYIRTLKNTSKCP